VEDQAGRVVAIFTCPEAGAPMVPREEVLAVPGRGLEGDRYFHRRGYYSHRHGPDREVTLIALEVLEWLRQEHGIDLDLSASRRNLVTRGLDLNALVGKEFRVGPVRMRGIRLCEPCAYLEERTGKPGLLEALVHRGGLRAQILNEGTIRVGDPVRVL